MPVLTYSTHETHVYLFGFGPLKRVGVGGGEPKDVMDK